MNRHRKMLCGLVIAWLSTLVVKPVEGADPSAEVDYQKHIRPLLVERCLKCHGFDPASRKAGLRLDDREAATKAAESGTIAIVPGKPEASELVRRIESKDDSVRMPPADIGKPLDEKEIALLKKWIAAGAPYVRHWSFEKPIKQPLPVVRNAAWSRGPMDLFVLGKLESLKLSPSPEADRATLARRAALDITGLPPMADDLKSYLDDKSPDAYEKYVDRLLASAAFGERWARPWLDAARYADTKGYEKDLRRTIWRWRDWAIEALNADMPFDQFTREQLAGDMLPNPTVEQLIATAFHRNTMVNEEGGTDDEEFRIAAVKDRVDTTLQVWMGLTGGCAKCHTHKYDPISNRDYYRFYAFFNQTEDADRGDESPTIPSPTPLQRQQSEPLQAQLASAQAKLKTITPELEKALPDWEASYQKQLAWQRVRASEQKAASGSAIELQADDSLLVKGAGPAKETYTVSFAAPFQRLTGLMLEVLPDASHPKGAVGRAKDDGNFVLTGIKLVAETPEGKQTELPFGRVTADHSQPGYPIDHVLKNPDPKKHGWGVAPVQTKHHSAVFTLASPAMLAAGTKLTLTLDHQFEYQYPGFSIGRFRISLSSQDSPAKVADNTPPAVVSILRTPVERRTDEQRHELLTFFASVARSNQPLRDEIARLQKSLDAIKPVSTPILRELPENRRRETRIHNRGNFLDPGDKVEAAPLPAFHAWPSDAPISRLGVAQWLTSRQNPLTARVAVNRVWAQLFGLGLVETQEDFGSQGTPPSNQALLDWLAVDYMDQGWSLKQLLRTIVTSATYRQTSKATPDLLARDRENRLLARGPRFRIEAEMLRDQALAVSGLLSRKQFGPSVMPEQPPGLWKSTYSHDKWETSWGDDRLRRGLYTFIKRTTPYPSMITFDATSREVCTIRRARTNTPLQALVTLNDPVYVECAQELSWRVLHSQFMLPADEIALAFRMCLVRSPKPEELAVLTELYWERRKAFERDIEGARTFAGPRFASYSQKDELPGYAAMTAVMQVIMNLDEFLTKG